MKNLILHIGFGKTGTSKLQKHIFPYIASIRNLKYFGDEAKDQNNIERQKINLILTNHVAKMDVGMECKKLNIPDNYLISNEELSSYRNAQYIDEFAEKNLIAFGPEAHVILGIREPNNWLSSVYLQLCAHEKPVVKPEHFFLNNKNYSERLPNVKFNIEEFSYSKIINAYKKRFKNFTYVKYECIKDMEFLQDIFNLNNSELDVTKKLYKNKIVNRGFSKNSYYITKKYGSFLNTLGLNYISKYSNEVLLDRINDEYPIQKSKQKNSIKAIISKRIGNIFHYKTIFQNFLDKILPYEKYIVNFDQIKNFNIDKLEKEYDGLLDWKTYRK